MFTYTLQASLSGTFLQRKDVVNQCLEFSYKDDPANVRSQYLWEL